MATHLELRTDGRGKQTTPTSRVDAVRGLARSDSTGPGGGSLSGDVEGETFPPMSRIVRPLLANDVRYCCTVVSLARGRSSVCCRDERSRDLSPHRVGGAKCDARSGMQGLDWTGRED